MQLDPGLPDRQKSGGQNGQQHLISPDPQHWCTAGLRPQPTPVLPVHTRLYSYTQLQYHRQICRWHNGDRPDHRQQRDGLQRGGTLTKWCQENHLSLNIDKTKELVVDYRRQSREHTPITIDKTPVERVNSFKFLGVHITEDLAWSVTQMQCWRRHISVSSPEMAEEVWNESQHPQVLLHLHCGEHPDRLHHRLVWKQHRWQPQSSAKGRANCPPHCWRWASLPPGYLHQAVYKESLEDYQRLQPPVPHTALSAALRETSPLPSGRRLRSIQSRTSRLRDSFFP